MSYENFYFHIGLHKTGTTFLQSRIFPNVEGIDYLRWRNLEYFLRLSKTKKYLISSEGLSGATFATAEQRCQAIARLAEMFPGSQVLISLRPHGAYLASLYSQYIRYGGTQPFERFFSIPSDTSGAILHGKDVSFRAVINAIEDGFEQAPFVFTLSDLQSRINALLADLGGFLGAELTPPGADDRRKRNPGLKSWQAELLRNINVAAKAKLTLDGRSRPYRRLARLRIDPPRLCTAVLGRFPGAPLVAAGQRKEIDQFYSEDWQFVCDYMARSGHRGRTVSD